MEFILTGQEQKIKFITDDDSAWLILDSENDNDENGSSFDIRTDSEIKILKKYLKQFLAFAPKSQAVNAASPPVFNCNDNKTFQYDIKRIFRSDDFSAFNRIAAHQFITLRKIFLKTAEFSEHLGSPLYISSCRDELSPDLIHGSPSIQSWIHTLIRLIELMNVPDPSYQNNPDLSPENFNEFKEKIQTSLDLLYEQVCTLKRQIEDFSKHFHRFEKLFRKVEKNIIKRLAANVCPVLVDKLKQSFSANRDIEIAKSITILSPADSGYSGVTDELSKKADDEKQQHITYSNDGNIYVQTITTDAELQENFNQLDTIEQIELILKFVQSFYSYLQSTHRLAVDCSSKFIIKPLPGVDKSYQSYLESRLIKLKGLAKNIDKGYPVEHTRCLHLIWQTRTMIQNIKLIMTPLSSMILSLPKTWNKIFQNNSFRLWNMGRFKSPELPQDWNSYNMSTKFDLVKTARKNYWCSYVVAPPYNNESSSPLMFQLVESALTGIIDFQSEYNYRIERMSTSQDIFEEDIEICSAPLQLLYVNTTILTRQFHNIFLQLRGPKPSNFGRIVNHEIDETVCTSKTEFLDYNFTNGTILNFWMFLAAQSFQLLKHNNEASKNQRLLQLIECFKAYCTQIEILQKVYEKILQHLNCIDNVLTFFEKLKTRSEQLMKIQDHKLCEINHKGRLPSLDNLLNSQTATPQQVDVDSSKKEKIVLVTICDRDINFTFPNKHAFNYSTMEHQSPILGYFFKTVIDLISYNYGFLTSNKAVTDLQWKNMAFLNNDDPSNILIQEIQQVILKPNMMNDLEILIALRSLRFLKLEINYVLATLYQFHESSKLIKENFPIIFRKIKKGRFISFNNFLPCPVSICTPNFLDEIFVLRN